MIEEVVDEMVDRIVSSEDDMGDMSGLHGLSPSSSMRALMSESTLKSSSSSPRVSRRESSQLRKHSLELDSRLNSSDCPCIYTVYLQMAVIPFNALHCGIIGHIAS